jgi:hypothetical protein
MTAALGLGFALAVAQMVGLTPLAQDAWVYWQAQPGDLYAESYRIADAPYAYSPAFADALIPFRLLPERMFTGLWQLAVVAVAVVTLRGLALPIILTGYVVWPLAFLGAGDVAHGNVFIMTGAAAVFGLRYPALWALPLLTKVTPGVGLLWFVARGEWRNLGIALGVTGAIALVSFVFIPGDWFAWVTFLTGGQPDFPLWTIPVPLWVRLPTAALLVVWGARTNRPWVLPVAAGWAMPLPYPLIVATMVTSLAVVGRSRATAR